MGSIYAWNLVSLVQEYRASIWCGSSINYICIDWIFLMIWEYKLFWHNLLTNSSAHSTMVSGLFCNIVCCTPGIFIFTISLFCLSFSMAKILFFFFPPFIHIKKMQYFLFPLDCYAIMLIMNFETFIILKISRIAVSTLYFSFLSIKVHLISWFWGNDLENSFVENRRISFPKDGHLTSLCLIGICT